MAEIEVGGLILQDDGSFRIKRTGEKVWLGDDGVLRDANGDEVDVDVSPETLPNGSGLDFTE